MTTETDRQVGFDGLCAIGHIDIGPRVPNAVENAELGMKELVTHVGETPGVIDMVGMKKLGRGNHFELIWRFSSEASYIEHLDGPNYRAFRAEIAPANAAPYWDRLHHVRVGREWPTAGVGDFVVITQLELQPQQLDEGLAALDRLVETQGTASGLLGQVLLQRLDPQFNLELLSVWTSGLSYEEHLASEEAKLVRDELTPLLIAPVEDRLHHVICGTWAAR